MERKEDGVMFLSIEKVDAERLAALQDDGFSLTYGEMTGFCEELAGLIDSRSLVFSLRLGLWLVMWHFYLPEWSLSC